MVSIIAVPNLIRRIREVGKYSTRNSQSAFPFDEFTSDPSSKLTNLDLLKAKMLYVHKYVTCLKERVWL